MDNFQSKRVTINDLPNRLEITIRAGRAWQDIAGVVFPGLLLVFFGYFFIRGQFDDLMAVIIWGALYCIVLYVFLNRIWWLLWGRETVMAGDGVLLIQRKGLLRFNTSENCLLENAKDFTADRDRGYFGSKYQRRITGLRGTVRFSCDGEQRRFGDMLDEDEADQIIWRMRAKKLIS